MQAKTSSDGHDLDSMEEEGIMSASSNGRRKESYRSVVKERRGDAAILPGGAG